MIIRPTAGGGWGKVCVCGSLSTARQIVDAINSKAAMQRHAKDIVAAVNAETA